MDYEIKFSADGGILDEWSEILHCEFNEANAGKDICMILVPT